MKPSSTSCDTRSRIIGAALKLIRRFGHARTTMADIAEDCGMSTANVYRFFKSKSAINDVICQLVMARLEEELREIATADLAASDRLAQLVERIALFLADLRADDRKVYDMITIAFAEKWQSIQQHLEVVRSLFSEVVESGLDNHEFDRFDRARIVRCAWFSIVGYWHPMVAAQFRDLPGVPTATEMTNFLLSAISGAKPMAPEPT